VVADLVDNCLILAFLLNDILGSTVDLKLKLYVWREYGMRLAPILCFTWIVFLEKLIKKLINLITLSFGIICLTQNQIFS